VFAARQGAEGAAAWKPGGREGPYASYKPLAPNSALPLFLDFWKSSKLIIDGFLLRKNNHTNSPVLAQGGVAGCCNRPDCATESGWQYSLFADALRLRQPGKED